ncbi:MAG: helix-turn-helix domain-containing protein [Clostridiales bacterium]|nr:helix-turn-helix domain-containing protein [Clostridiales bacterium]
MINSNLLKAKIIEFGYSQKDIADFLNISLATLNYKINGKREFKMSEIAPLCKILNLNETELNQIFLSCV